ncbi:unnamed protein product [Leptidea sinapis]|uniref:Uncharacterized protein n=1 Tax=Leptidea sinapis TaxID=189913 RepID=A0A5E4PRI5_9NEOP|nr:unnamed protein product [Leptidea sinapis]
MKLLPHIQDVYDRLELLYHLACQHAFRLVLQMSMPTKLHILTRLNSMNTVKLNDSTDKSVDVDIPVSVSMYRWVVGEGPWLALSDVRHVAPELWRSLCRLRRRANTLCVILTRSHFVLFSQRALIAAQRERSHKQITSSF